MLDFIGLAEGEEAAYRMLVQRGPASWSAVADHLRLGEREAARLLSRLESRGMVTPVADAPGRYAAAPPPLAFGGALAERRHALQEAEAEVAALAEDYRRLSAGPGRSDVVEVLTGAGPIRHRFEQLQRGATHELQVLVTAEPMAVRGEEHQAEEQATARGVNYRVVIEESVLEQPSTLVELSSALDRAQQVRVVERVPTKLVVADRSIALLPLQSTAEAEASAEAAALVVHAGGLVEALVGLFEGVWVTARPLLMSSTGEVVEEPQTEGPDETDLLILSLMLTGLTDRKVAARLDVSLRTMQRRVQRLAELSGVTTRMQLGWHAYEQGWVKR
ncbi:helix-turn-helix domain-containing protein [Streptomyces sp. NBC_00234]|uniref:TrmB family transcriptional regulator n=1 Tax=Streptomyces sp. NBC_00234 TaxID=2903638 RepID=UPI002E2AD206|nr:helix-turn-helix domain-containing protein [Streptomyces sp. NBC_00234]